MKCAKGAKSQVSKTIKNSELCETIATIAVRETYAAQNRIKSNLDEKIKHKFSIPEKSELP